MTNFKQGVNQKPKVVIRDGKVPTVFIAEQALNKMYVYIKEMSDEIGWLGTVLAYPEHNQYLIDEVYLFKQQVHGTTTEITPEGLEEFAQEILMEPNGVEIWNNMKLWGHSHVNMGVFASGQDDKQMEDFAGIGHDFFIRLIGNKKGELRIDFYDYKNGIEYHDIGWLLHQEEISTNQQQIEALEAQLEALYKAKEVEQKQAIKQLEAPIKEEIKQKVSKLTYKTVAKKSSTPAYGTYNYWQDSYSTQYGGGWYDEADELDYQHQGKYQFALVDYIDNGKVYEHFTMSDINYYANMCNTKEEMIAEMADYGELSFLSENDVNLIWEEVKRVGGIQV